MKKWILILTLVALVFTSCKKENASHTSFWFKKGISDAMINLNGATELTVYIDEVSVGVIAANDWKSGPDCNGANFTIVNNLGKEDSKTFNYIVRDQFGDDRFTGSYTAIKDECLSIELLP